MSGIQDVINVALAQRGKPYVFATAGPDTFDCSGLVAYAFKQGANVDLPHYTGYLLGKGIAVPRESMIPGDLVFPSTGHVGIYLGNGKMVDAPHTGAVVRIDDVWGWVAARRIAIPGSGGSGLSDAFSIPDVPGVSDIKGEIESLTGAVKSLYNFFEHINDAVRWITDPANVRRTILFMVGAMIFLFAIAKVGWGPVSKTVKDVTNVG